MFVGFLFLSIRVPLLVQGSSKDLRLGVQGLGFIDLWGGGGGGTYSNHTSIVSTKGTLLSTLSVLGTQWVD